MYIYIPQKCDVYCTSLVLRLKGGGHLVLESVRDAVLGGDDGGRLLDLLAENLGLDEPGQPDCEFVADELLGRDLEDLCGARMLSVVFFLGGLGFRGAGWQLTVDFLESELLCLTDEAKDHEPGDEVQAGVEADCLKCQYVGLDFNGKCLGETYKHRLLSWHRPWLGKSN